MYPERVGWRSSSVLVIKILVLTLFLLVLSGVGSQLLPALDSAGANPEAAPISLILGIMLCQVLALALPVVRSRWRGWTLALTLFVVFFGTQTFMSQIESLVYLGDKMPRELVAGLFKMGLFVAAVFSPIAVLTLGRWKKNPATDPGGRNVLNPGKKPRASYLESMPPCGTITAALTREVFSPRCKAWSAPRPGCCPFNTCAGYSGLRWACWS